MWLECFPGQSGSRPSRLTLQISFMIYRHEAEKGNKSRGNLHRSPCDHRWKGYLHSRPIPFFRFGPDLEISRPHVVWTENSPWNDKFPRRRQIFPVSLPSARTLEMTIGSLPCSPPTQWEMICRKYVETVSMSLKFRFQHHKFVQLTQ